MLNRNFFDDSFNNIWSHEFEQGDTQKEREKWLSDVVDSMKKKGVEIAVHKRLDGTGYDFGFLNRNDKNTFVFDTFGDLEGKHSHKQIFNGYTDRQMQIWKQTAEKWAQQNNVSYKVEHHWNEIKFTFNRFSVNEAFGDQIKQFDKTALNKVVYPDFANNRR